MTLVIVCSVIAVAVLILIALVVFTQKHRSNKRKRLEGSLMRNSDPAVWFVCWKSRGYDFRVVWIGVIMSY